MLCFPASFAKESYFEKEKKIEAALNNVVILKKAGWILDGKNFVMKKYPCLI